MVEPFTKWYEANKAAFELENEILRDKLAQGVNGVEWLVMQVLADGDDKELLHRWLEYLKRVEQKEANKVMLDSLIMNKDEFYKKYELNWWISVDHTLIYLNLLKERNYDSYMVFIKNLEEQGG